MRLIPAHYLTLRQAADTVATGIYCGLPDTTLIERLKESAFEVADGEAIEKAISQIWAAVDKEKLQAFVVGGPRATPLKLSASISKAIPGLRNPRGGDLSLLRPSNTNFEQFRALFGRDLSKVSVIFREMEVTQLARACLQSRRRKTSSASGIKVGRPSRKNQVETTIRDLIEARKWAPTEPIKSLTYEVNTCGKWLNPVSEDTVTRVLDELYSKTKNRRYERLRRMKSNAARRA